MLNSGLGRLLARPLLLGILPLAMQPAETTAAILVIEDSPELVSLLQRVLNEEGYAVHADMDGEAGLANALASQPNLVILDVGLPDRSGLDVVKDLRRNGVDTPTLMLSGKGTVADRIAGLNAGADDYLVKPFDPDELVARVRALLRRVSAHGRVPRLCVGDVVLDPLTRDVFRGGRRLVLTQREFSLLEFFVRNAGKPLTRSAIAQQVWRQTAPEIEETNIVDVYVAYLRKKLDAEGEEPMLHTVRGVGYVMRAASV